ncbi:MAG: RsmE family RNA methyltransferase [Isosphaeraceae bacterium]
MSDRFYSPTASKSGAIRLDPEESHHLARVRRLGVGDQVVVFDGQGFATRARVVSISKNTVELEAEGPPLPDHEAEIRLTLAVAPPKGDRFDWLVEKATEIGVSRLVPLLTERCIVDPRPAKLDRLRRTVIESSKQCGRNRLMEISAPCPFAQWIGEGEALPRFLAHPSGQRLPSHERLPLGCSALLAIGPEGGYTDAELDLARAKGWSILGLGSTILRVETAALVGSVQLLSHVAITSEPTGGF